MKKRILLVIGAFLLLHIGVYGTSADKKQGGIRENIPYPKKIIDQLHFSIPVGGISIAVKMEKRIKKGTKIPVEIFLKETKSENSLLNFKKTEFDFLFILKNKQNELMPKTEKMKELDSLFFFANVSREIKKNEILFCQFDLLSFFKIKEPGEYTFQVKRKVYILKNKEYILKWLESSPIIFSIIQ